MFRRPALIAIENDAREPIMKSAARRITADTDAQRDGHGKTE